MLFSLRIHLLDADITHFFNIFLEIVNFESLYEISRIDTKYIVNII